jgi:hypothetical protein
MKIKAYLNHGRWIAPLQTGKGFMEVKPGDDGIIFPDNWHEIVEALRQRPVENMNWQPGETLADLKRENIEHAVGATLPDVTITKGGN